MTKQYGTSSRTYKSALIWVASDSSQTMQDEARKLMAWTDIEAEGLNLDDAQQRQLTENIKKAKRDLRESVWRSYNKVLLLDRDNTIKTIDLGLVTSSAADTMCRHILNQLRQTDDVVKDISPRSLVKNWPPAFVEWSTKSVRDAFYASPQFPRLLNPEAIKDAISRGVAEGQLAYVGKSPKGEYSPFYFKKALSSTDVEISEDTFIIKAEEAEKHIKPPELTRIAINPSEAQIQPGKKQAFTANGLDQHGRDFEVKKIDWAATGGTISKDGVFQAGKDEGNFRITAKGGKVAGEAVVVISTGKPLPPTPPPGSKTLTWSGEVPAQKWMNFYTKVLTRFVKGGKLKINVSFEAAPEGGVSERQVEETKASLRDQGLNDDVKT